MDGIDGTDGGGANGGVAEAPTFDLEAPALVAAAGPLPKMLAFEGFTVTSLAIGALVRPPKKLSAHKLLPAAYYLDDFVLFLFGVGLMVLSVAVAGNLVHGNIAKAVMWGTLAPLLLLLALVIGQVHWMIERYFKKYL
ncbi:uncharacterized protein [Elaeis guineensis]|uniref:uncharacterized protein isoform X2 n=1 Tax=Elaeis guineensis var. tenera TaxID=51953 RepID=UPI003C6CFB1F